MKNSGRRIRMSTSAWNSVSNVWNSTLKRIRSVWNCKRAVFLSCPLYNTSLWKCDVFKFGLHLKLQHTSESQVMFQTPATVHFIINFLANFSGSVYFFELFWQYILVIAIFPRWNTSNNLAVSHLVSAGHWQMHWYHPETPVILAPVNIILVFWEMMPLYS